MKAFSLSLLALCLCAMPVGAVPALRIYSLQCEQMDSPLGVDTQAPCFAWKLTARDRGAVQSAYQLMVATSEEALTQGRSDVWDSGKVTSDCSIMVPYEGKPLSSATTYYWRVRSWDGGGEVSPWSQTATFTTGLLTEADWAGAQWIALDEDKEKVIPAIHSPLVRDAFPDGAVSYPLPQFRKVFPVRGQVSQALLYVTGLGQFECFLNGEKVGDHFLDPGWTKYDKEALYLTFDVTQGIREGSNVLGVMLGNGFYNTPMGRYYKMVGSFGTPKMRLRLMLRYTDGTSESVVSDTSWKVTESPVTFSSIYGGEDYNATLLQQGWNADPTFSDSHWHSALEVRQDIDLKAQLGTTLAVRDTIQCMLRYLNGQGSWVYDMGQNFSGIIRVRLKSKGSQTVTLRPAELQNADKTVNQSASGSPYYFRYTTRGDNEVETWQPQFSYYGFRYVQVEGAVPEGEANPDNLPEVVELVGLHTTASAPEAGTFHCSKPMFNDIYNLIDWAIRSNLASVTTDCPHREKLGWQEQNHLMQCSMQYRYSLLPLYRKIMDDLAASQHEDGCIPTTAPEYVSFSDGFEDSPEWGCSFIICPWYIYQWYGDLRPMQKHYAAMRRYIDYLSSCAEGHIVAYGLGDWFDIGPANPGRAQLTSVGLTATAIYYYEVMLMGKMAALLGERADEERYTSLAGEIREAYIANFYHPADATYDRGSQTANAMSLYMGLVPDGERDRVLASLVADIEGRGFALTAGDIGYRYVLCALLEGGRSDVIYNMNSRYDVPGYGWQLTHGATALTESWQAYDYVSNNHLMLGHLMEWLFGGVGGIRQAEGSIAWRDIVIDPQFVGDVRSAECRYESPYGEIRCEWNKTQTAYTLRVDVPVGCRATVCLPSEDPMGISEGGQPILDCEDISLAGQGEGKTHWNVGSGTYMFRVIL